VNVALEAIDRIRDTAASHDRIFFIERWAVKRLHRPVVRAGGGAEAIFIRRSARTSINMQGRSPGAGRRERLGDRHRRRGRGGGRGVHHPERFKAITGLDYRVTILAIVQRGGAPTAFDRFWDEKGGKGRGGLIDGHRNEMVGLQDMEMELVHFADMWNKKKTPDLRWLNIANMMPYRATAGKTKNG